MSFLKWLILILYLEIIPIDIWVLFDYTIHVEKQ